MSKRSHDPPALQSRHPGESRDPFRWGPRQAKWVPAFAGTTECLRCSSHRFLRKPRRFAIRLLFPRRPNESDEQRMPVARCGGEFRMELARDKPRMVRQLDHLDEQVVHRFAGDHEAKILELLPIAVV